MALAHYYGCCCADELCILAVQAGLLAIAPPAAFDAECTGSSANKDWTGNVFMLLLLGSLFPVIGEASVWPAQRFAVVR